MTGKWRVYNDHPQGLTHREKFKGDDFEIPAGQFIEMDYEDAIQFKSQYYPIKMTNQGIQDPMSYKCLRVVASPGGDTGEKAEEKVKIFVSPVDGKEFTSKDELDKYLDENFAHLRVKDEAAEDEIKKSRARSVRS